MKQFPRVLAEWMGERRYDEVAPLLGAAVGTVHAWRHGTTLPAASRIPVLAAAMGVSEEELRRAIKRSRHPKKRASNATNATADEVHANGGVP